MMLGSRTNALRIRKQCYTVVRKSRKQIHECKNYNPRLLLLLEVLVLLSEDDSLRTEEKTRNVSISYSLNLKVREYMRLPSCIEWLL